MIHLKDTDIVQEAERDQLGTGSSMVVGDNPTSLKASSDSCSNLMFSPCAAMKVKTRVLINDTSDFSESYHSHRLL